jgi:hypothetical protein
VDDDRERDQARDQGRRMTLSEAAEVLGISKDAVRMRVRRDSLRSEKGEDGRVHVFVDATRHATTGEGPQDDPSAELVEVLRAQVEDLQSRLDRETEANRENRRIIAGLIERVPELEAPAREEPRGSDLSAEEEEPISTPTGQRTAPESEVPRPWWRRILRG